MAEQHTRIIILKKIITYLLLAFVVFSIGFAAGKEFAATGSPVEQASAAGNDSYTLVYYLRSTFRCWQCNMIEIYSDELIRNEFADYVEAGLLEWRIVDYLQDKELANHYNISGNTIIVARFEDGVEVSHERLDQVMEKVLNRDEFMSYLSEAIVKSLNA